jgi:GTPase SAR1 family protein
MKNGQFDNNISPTICASFDSLHLRQHNSKLHVWDVSGSRNIQALSIAKTYLSNVNCFLLCYDNLPSLREFSNIINEINKYSSCYILILIITKIDLLSGGELKEIKKKLKDYKIDNIFYTSSKLNYGIDELVNFINVKIIETSPQIKVCTPREKHRASCLCF